MFTYSNIYDTIKDTKNPKKPVVYTEVEDR